MAVTAKSPGSALVTSFGQALTQIGSRMAGSAVVLGSALALAACGPLISFGDGEPETVYTLNYEPQRLDEPSGPLLFISEPTVIGGLGGRSITVRLGDFERTTLKNVRWTTASTDLIREYLILSLRDSASLRTLGETGLDVSARCRLNTTIQAMEFVPGADPSADAVAFRTELTLVNQVSGQQVAHQVFDAGRRVEGSTKGIIDGFNAAMADIAAQSSRWLGTAMTSCR